jgi:hypothetical protein
MCAFFCSLMSPEAFGVEVYSPIETCCDWK